MQKGKRLTDTISTMASEDGNNQQNDGNLSVGYPSGGNQSNLVQRIQLKKPPFWKKDPQLWFVQLEFSTKHESFTSCYSRLVYKYVIFHVFSFSHKSSCANKSPLSYELQSHKKFFFGILILLVSNKNKISSSVVRKDQKIIIISNYWFYQFSECNGQSIHSHGHFSFYTKQSGEWWKWGITVTCARAFTGLVQNLPQSIPRAHRPCLSSLATYDNQQ